MAIFEQTERVTDEFVRNGLADALSALPLWRRSKALSYRFPLDKYLCARSYLMVCQLLKEHYGIDEQPIFSYGVNGKPLLRDYPDIYFNISHCSAAISCVVASLPVGIDVENYGYDALVAPQVLSPGELKQVHSALNPAQEFARFWTAKESLLKLRGSGISDEMHYLLEREAEDVSFSVRDYPAWKCIVTIAIKTAKSGNQ